MIHSMTGYGSGRARKKANSVAVEISSVNHKQRDLRFNLPSELAFLEPSLKQQLSESVLRGSISINLTYDLSPEHRAGQIELDTVLAGQLIEKFKALQNEYKLKAEIRLGDLAAIPGVVKERQEILPSKILTGLARQAMERAIANLQKSRAEEGEAIFKDLDMRTAKLEKHITEIEEGCDETLKYYRDQLLQRIAELGVDLPVDDERLAKEVAFTAQKADITEEMVRLRSHINQFRNCLFSKDPGMGRQLQFLTQEMLREIGTLAAKTRQSAVSREAIAFKTELDRVREQVANVE